MTIRSLLEHMGIDTARKTISVAGAPVDTIGMDLKRINVQPGDVFVIRLPVRQFSQEAAATVKARFRDAVGPHTPVVVVGEDVDVTVYRPVGGG